jgi:hypothetical protein
LCKDGFGRGSDDTAVALGEWTGFLCVICVHADVDSACFCFQRCTRLSASVVDGLGCSVLSTL